MTFEETTVKFEQNLRKYFGDGEINRNNLDHETEKRFIDDVYAIYEEYGFASRFESPFNLYPEQQEHEGQTFEVIGRVEEGPNWDLESLPAWNIKFADGFTMEAYPEEICRYDKEDDDRYDAFITSQYYGQR